MTTRQQPLFGADLGELRKVKWPDLALRFAFGAAISVIAGVAGILLGKTVGGMLLAFPAILPATLTLLEKEEGNRAAVRDVGGAIFGAIGLVVFAIAAAFLFERIAVGEVLLVSLAAWLATSIAFYVLRATGLVRLPEPLIAEVPRANKTRRRRGG
jgi:hypothetical protein